MLMAIVGMLGLGRLRHSHAGVLVCRLGRCCSGRLGRGRGFRFRGVDVLLAVGMYVRRALDRGLVVMTRCFG